MNINLESLWSHNLQLAFDCLNAWPITCYVSVQVQKFSVSVQHLNLYLSKINLKRTLVKNLLISQFHPNFLEIFGSSGNFFGSSGLSAELLDFLRKFRTFCGSSEHSSEVPDFKFFQVFNLHTPSSLSIPQHPKPFPAPRTPSPLSPEHLSLKNHCSEVPRSSEVWIQVLEGPQIICIPFPKGSPQVSR